MSLVREGRAGDSSPNVRSGRRHPSLVAWPLSGRDALAILPPIFAVAVVPRSSSHVPRQGQTRRRFSPKYWGWQSTPKPCRVALVREGRSGDPPPNIRCRRPPSLVAWPLSGRDTPAILHQIFVTCPLSGTDAPANLPQIFVVGVAPQASSRGPRQGGEQWRSSPKYSRWQSSPEPRCVGLARKGRAGDPPLNIRLFVLAVVPRASSHIPCQGGTRWRSSPKYSRCPSSPEPRRVAPVRKGRASDPSPNIHGGLGPPSLVALSSSGRDAPAILRQIFALAIVPRASSRVPRQGGACRRFFPKYSRLQSHPRFSPALVREGRAGNPSPNSCSGSRPPSLVVWPSSGRECQRSSPKYSGWQSPPKPSRVAPVREGRTRRVARVRERRAGDPHPNIHGMAVDRGEDVPLVLLPPSLVTWLS